MVYWFCRDDDLVTTGCILKQSFIIFTTYNSLLTAFISLFKTAFRLAFKKGAFTTLVMMALVQTVLEWKQLFPPVSSSTKVMFSSKIECSTFTGQMVCKTSFWTLKWTHHQRRNCKSWCDYLGYGLLGWWILKQFQHHAHLHQIAPGFVKCQACGCMRMHCPEESYVCKASFNCQVVHCPT